MEKGAVVKRRREDPQLIANAVVKRLRRNPQLIGEFVAHPAFLHAFQTAARQLDVIFPSLYRRPFKINALNAMRSRVCPENRLSLIAAGRLCVKVAERLLCFNGECSVRYAFRLGTCILSRRHFFRKSSATCVATLAGKEEEEEDEEEEEEQEEEEKEKVKEREEGHSSYIWSVAFHPTAPLLATGSHDKTARLWLLSSDNSSATCVATLKGHRSSVRSVAFHPTAPLLATGSDDSTVRLWLLSSDNSSATCVATLEEHWKSVRSVAFHPTAPLLATGSDDSTVRLWLLSSDNSSATCVATLEVKERDERHSYGVDSVAFHPTAPLLATGSWDKTVRLWR